MRTYCITRLIRSDTGDTVTYFNGWTVRNHVPMINWSQDHAIMMFRHIAHDVLRSIMSAGPDDQTAEPIQIVGLGDAEGLPKFA